MRIAAGDVPPLLRGVSIRSLDLALLQAGAGVKGEFENRLKGLIDEVKSSPTPIILFIDEAHTLIGAGGAGGPGRCRQPPEAGPGPRGAAYNRGHHLVRVQEVHREGSGPEPAIPGREGRGARRGGLPGHDAGGGPAPGDAPQGAHPGRRHRRRGAPFAPLPARPAAPRQGRERAGHRVRAPGSGPERDACTAGERHTDASTTWTVQERVLRREAAPGIDHSERLELIATERVAVAGRAAGAQGAMEQGARAGRGRSGETRERLEATVDDGGDKDAGRAAEPSGP